MIINKNGHATLSTHICRACHRFARNARLKIADGPNDQFTIQQALDNDDEYWFNKNSMTVSDMEEFIKMGLAYAVNFDRVPCGMLTLHINCPNCECCIMTPKQFVLNSVQFDDTTFVVCNTCGEVIRADEKIYIKARINK